MKTLITLAIVVIVGLMGAIGFAYSGLYNVGASSPHNGFLNWLLSTTSHASVERRARDIEVIELELPDEHERLEILAIHTADMKLDADVRLEELARRTEGMSGADLTTLCRRTGFERLQSYIAAHGDKVERMIEQFTVRMEDFSHALTAASALQSRNSGSAPQ